MTFDIAYMANADNRFNVRREDVEKLLVDYGFEYKRDTRHHALWVHCQYQDLIVSVHNKHSPNHRDTHVSPRSIESAVQACLIVEERNQRIFEQPFADEIDREIDVPPHLASLLSAVRNGNDIALYYTWFPEFLTRFTADERNQDNAIRKHADPLILNHQFLFNAMESLQKNYGVIIQHDANFIYFMQYDLGINIAFARNGEEPFKNRLGQTIQAIDEAARQTIDERYETVLLLEERGFKIL